MGTGQGAPRITRLRNALRLRELVELDYPDAGCIRMVQDLRHALL